jgi:hypothetical protein
MPAMAVPHTDPRSDAGSLVAASHRYAEIRRVGKTILVILFLPFVLVAWGKGGGSGSSTPQCSVGCGDCGRGHCDAGDKGHSGSHHCNRCGYTWG